jgi:hypothetical protein
MKTKLNETGYRDRQLTRWPWYVTRPLQGLFALLLLLAGLNATGFAKPSKPPKTQKKKSGTGAKAPARAGSTAKPPGPQLTSPAGSRGTVNSAGYRWKNVRIGGGGMVDGLDLSPDGKQLLVRTDTYGGYSWNGSTWDQVVTTASMPAAQRVPGNGAGVLGLVMAPSKPDRTYMAYRGLIYRSDDGAKSWNPTGFPGSSFDANGPTRAWGPRLAVDPTNPDVVLFGSIKDGLFMSRDGAKSWEHTSVPAGGEVSGMQAGISFVGFIPGTNGVTQMVAASNGTGFWVSNDTGLNWSMTSGGPVNVVSADIGSDGLLGAIAFGERDDVVWFLEGGNWSKMTGVGDQFRGNSGALEVTTLTIDDKNPNRILMAEASGEFWISSNRGRQWTHLNKSVTGGDVPWLVRLLSGSEGGYLTVGDIAFDPANPDTAYLTMGTGVLKLSGLQVAPQSGKVNLQVMTKGIEELVVNRVIAPPGGPVVVAVHDFGVFAIDDADSFNVIKGPENRFIGSWDVSYSPFQPSHLVADTVNLINDKDMLSGSSDNGGKTWNTFPARPRGEPATGRDAQSVKFTGCGSMVASTPDNVLWVPNGQFAPWENNRYVGCFTVGDSIEAIRPQITTDGGKTWQSVTLPGVDDSNDNIAGYDANYYLSRRNIAADTVAPGVFYMHHAFTGTYRSVDGGLKWDKVSSTPAGTGYEFNLDMHAVPGQQGHLFLADGGRVNDRPLGPSDFGGGPFYRTVDGGKNWTPLGTIDWVTKFGFGKPEKDKGYPTIFATGRVKNVWGLWRSTDAGKTWKSTGQFPNDTLDSVVSIDGDKSVFGRVYVGLGGSGVVVGEPK